MTSFLDLYRKYSLAATRTREEPFKNGSILLSDIVTARPVLYSGDALPIGNSAVHRCHGMNYATKYSCSAASLLCPFRVAHISRVIGKFDSTANPCD
jgi:hypothetical protein